MENWQRYAGTATQFSNKLTTGYNPLEDDKEYVGTRLLDAIESGVGSLWGGLQEAAKDQEGIGDDILRLMGGGIMNTATAISYIPGIKQIGQLEDWLAARGRDASGYLTPELDPRFAGWGTRLLTNWVGDKGLSNAGKFAKARILKKFKGYQGLIGGVGAGFIDTSPNRWRKFGYLGGRIPGQIRRTPSAADSLEEFYTKVQTFQKTGKTVEEFPLYWVNPDTGDVYSAVTKKEGLRSTRLGLKSKNRALREGKQSSLTQQSAARSKKKQVAAKNQVSKDEFLDRRDSYFEELEIIDNMIEDGLDNLPEGHAAAIVRYRKQLTQEIDTFLDNPYAYYNEHGYNIGNERVIDKLDAINAASTDGKQFLIGDATNLHPKLDRDGFKKFKDLLEGEINSTTKGKVKEYYYENIVVNYNPNLNQTRHWSEGNWMLKEVDDVIRLENLKSITRHGDYVHGSNIRQLIEAGFPDGIRYKDLIEIFKQNGWSMNKKGIRKWLESIGVFRLGVGQRTLKQGKKRISTTLRPSEKLSDTIKRIKKPKSNN